jgi:salicylate hydroxylase
MDTYKDSFTNPYAIQPFKIIIASAGIASLASAIRFKRAGHYVVICEQLHKIAEVGAGIQMAPNAARIIGRFRLLGQIIKKANVLERNSLRRWEGGRELGRRN